jgi:uncharacterized damage-inducible protein DinB
MHGAEVPVEADLQRAFERLESSRVALLAQAGRQDAEALNRPSRPGAWSAGQILHHLLMSETLTLGYINKKMQAGAALPRAGVASRLRLLALRVALASPLRVRAPAATSSVPEQVELAALRARWDETRASWRQLLDAFPSELRGRVVFRHPFVGLLRIEETLGFLQAHLEHHARQVVAALAAAGRA